MSLPRAYVAVAYNAYLEEVESANKVTGEAAERRGGGVAHETSCGIERSAEEKNNGFQERRTAKGHPLGGMRRKYGRE